MKIKVGVFCDGEDILRFRCTQSLSVLLSAVSKLGGVSIHLNVPCSDEKFS